MARLLAAVAASSFAATGAAAARGQGSLFVVTSTSHPSPHGNLQLSEVDVETNRTVMTVPIEFPDKGYPKVRWITTNNGNAIASSPEHMYMIGQYVWGDNASEPILLQISKTNGSVKELAVMPTFNFPGVSELQFHLSFHSTASTVVVTSLHYDDVAKLGGPKHWSTVSVDIGTGEVSLPVVLPEQWGFTSMYGAYNVAKGLFCDHVYTQGSAAPPTPPPRPPGPANCSAPPHQRGSCGDPGQMNRTACDAARCCWDAQDNWCFYSQPAPDPSKAHFPTLGCFDTANDGSLVVNVTDHTLLDVYAFDSVAQGFVGLGRCCDPDVIPACPQECKGKVPKHSHIRTFVTWDGTDNEPRIKRVIDNLPDHPFPLATFYTPGIVVDAASRTVTFFSKPNKFVHLDADSGALRGETVLDSKIEGTVFVFFR